jgi:hypothetical protein
MTTGDERAVLFGYSDGNSYASLNTADNGYVQLSGPPIVSQEWMHLTLTYNGSKAKMYVDGALITTSSIPSTRGLISDPSEKLQVMGAVDPVFGGYNNSLVHFQDFRLYNGTNKNYTGSFIALPDSMVEYLFFFDPSV